jgi:hypothetical protein
MVIPFIPGSIVRLPFLCERFLWYKRSNVNDTRALIVGLAASKDIFEVFVETTRIDRNGSTHPATMDREFSSRSDGNMLSSERVIEEDAKIPTCKGAATTLRTGITVSIDKVPS